MRYIKTGMALLVAAGLSVTAVAHPKNSTPVHKDMPKKHVLISHNGTQSNGRGFNWAKYFTVSGLFNIDATYAEHGWGKSVPGYVPGFERSDASDISVNNANLLVDAQVNPFTKAHVGVVYQDRVGPLSGSLGSNLVGSQVSQISGIDPSRLSSSLQIDEAYVTLGGQAQQPFYVKLGREFIPFGHYNPYPVTYSLTQLLSQVNATALQLGYAYRGMNLDVYTFGGAVSGFKSANLLNTRIKNYGFKLSYMNQFNDMSYHANVGFIRDMRDGEFTSLSVAGTQDSLRASGMSAHVDVASGPVDLSMDYVAALGNIYYTVDQNTVVKYRPHAYSLMGGYAFNTLDHASKVHVGYEHAGKQHDKNFMPKKRILADYTVALGHNTDATVQYVHDTDFTSKDDKVTPKSNTVNLRLGVHF